MSQDVLFDNMTHEQYMQVIRPKFIGARNLHYCLGPHGLDFFILLSSAAGIYGTRGQAAYAASSTYFGAFARWRAAQGLSTTALHLGPIDEIGYIANNAARREEIVANFGDEGLSKGEFFGILEAAVRGQIAENECITFKPMTGRDMPYWAADAKFAHLRSLYSPERSGRAEEKPLIKQQIQNATTKDALVNFVAQAIGEKIVAILGIDAAEIQPSKPIVAYGLDSLVAIELRNFIEREFRAKMPLLEILARGSIDQLAEEVVQCAGLSKEDGVGLE